MAGECQGVRGAHDLTGRQVVEKSAGLSTAVAILPCPALIAREKIKKIPNIDVSAGSSHDMSRSSSAGEREGRVLWPAAPRTAAEDL